jgi:hypothetical protein
MQGEKATRLLLSEMSGDVIITVELPARRAYSPEGKLREALGQKGERRGKKAEGEGSAERMLEEGANRSIHQAL